MVTFLNFNLLIFILFFPYLFIFFIHTISSFRFFFFIPLFSPPHTYPYSFLFFLLSSFFPTTSSKLQNILELSLSLSLFFFFCFLSLFSLTTSSKLERIPELSLSFFLSLSHKQRSPVDDSSSPPPLVLLPTVAQMGKICFVFVFFLLFFFVFSFFLF